MFMTYLSIVVRLSRVFSERQMSVHNLGFPEQSILMYLANGGTVHQDVIARHFMIDKGTIAKTVSKLEKKNLLSRRENPDNKREKLITLTEDGRGMLGRMQQVLDDWNKNLGQGISPEDMQHFMLISKKMAENAALALEKSGGTDHGES